MNILHTLDLHVWNPEPTETLQQEAVNAIENGEVLYMPDLAFALSDAEKRFLSPAWSDGKSKNISLDRELLRGAAGSDQDLSDLKAMITRFANQAEQLVTGLFPAYVPHLTRARTSFRPFEVEQRVSSYKKDDKRLHVDAFPSRPNHGERILRVFSNLNPEGRPRVWRLGEPFEDLAKRYLPRIGKPLPGSAKLMQMLGITKCYRTEYDSIMLGLHDTMKADVEYQKNAPQQEVALPPGSTWIVFTDQVLHAAMGGQYMLEQTFHLPVTAQVKPETAPLRVLERLAGHVLV
jgi:hypothetical protein